MCGQRIIRSIRNIVSVFKDGQEVDIADIGFAMEKRDGRIRWSRCEIAGAMPKVSDVFIPTGEKTQCNLKTYIVKHNL